ncbi:oxygenase MpaB family protein [Pedobacter sp. L105]|uniref:oxygenase MpaB family protein n=1 Tax=Pedobacter sp. L105 TaxID=1641871 RepID=UPI00131E8BF8|nr:oxygenase MpaB family protein [Pedobacter sp. L105]
MNEGYSNEFLTAKRQLADAPADLLIQAVFADTDTQQKTIFRDVLSQTRYNTDLRNLVAVYPQSAFISKANESPQWANRLLMEIGSAFFAKHAENIMTLLGLLSLPYCYTASNGAMVLYLSDRMRNETAKRLTDTATFVWDVMAPNAFAANGKGFASILKIRLTHAAARFYTLKSGHWQDGWGLPINQEDMAGTNLSFSLIVIRGLRKLGFAVSETEQKGFLHLWNVIGYLLGLDQDLIPEDSKQAQLLEKAISKRQFKVSPHGAELTQLLVQYITSANASKAAAGEITGLMRYLLGKDVADMLRVPGSELPAYQLELLQFSNAFKSLQPVWNTKGKYNSAHLNFKRQNSFKAVP